MTARHTTGYVGDSVEAVFATAKQLQERLGALGAGESDEVKKLLGQGLDDLDKSVEKLQKAYEMKERQRVLAG